MNIPKSVLDQLFQTLSEYNPATNLVMDNISKVMQPLGVFIVGVLFLIELSNYSKQFDKEDGGITIHTLANIGMKYLIAALLIMSSGLIIDAIMWFGIQMGKWINSAITESGTSDVIPSIGKAKWWQKPLLFLFEFGAYFCLGLSSFITTVLIFLRSIQLYIVKAIAPILIAFFVSEEFKPIAVGFLKHVMALVLQGALLVLIIGLIPILTANDYLSFVTGDGGFLSGAGAVIINIFDYVTLIVKYVVIIIVLVGSQGMAKRFVGAM